MAYCFTKTPQRITEAIRTFADELGCKTLSYLPIAPQPWCRPIQCYGNVDIALQLEGGRLATGHSILTNGNLFLTSEFHCVWERGDELVDLTPDIDPKINHRLFADSGRRIDRETEAWPEFVEEVSEMGLNGGGGHFKLLVESTRLKRLVQEKNRLDSEICRMSNEALVKGQAVSSRVTERHYRAQDSLVCQLEAFLKPRPDIRKMRKRKKDERKRKKKQRQLARGR